MKHKRSNTRRKGNTILESAFVFLPLFAMIFAIIDYSLVVFIQGTFKHAAREGVRFGVTNRLFGGETTHADSIRAIVQESAMGFLAGSAGRQKIDVRYYNPTTFAEVTGASATTEGNILEVTISPCTGSSDCFTWGWMAPLQTGWTPDGAMTGRATSALTISARSSDRMEPPGGAGS